MHRHECNTHNFLFDLENQTRVFPILYFKNLENKCWKSFKIMIATSSKKIKSKTSPIDLVFFELFPSSSRAQCHWKVAGKKVLIYIYRRHSAGGWHKATASSNLCAGGALC
jgi:hypothetical protein